MYTKKSAHLLQKIGYFRGTFPVVFGYTCSGHRCVSVQAWWHTAGTGRVFLSCVARLLWGRRTGSRPHLFRWSLSTPAQVCTMSLAQGQKQVILSGKGIVMMTAISYAPPYATVEVLPDTEQHLSSLPIGVLITLVLLPLEPASSEAEKRTTYRGKPERVHARTHAGHACCCLYPGVVRWLKCLAGEAALPCVG